MYIDEETSRLRLIVNWIVDIVVVISVAWFIVFSLGTQITMTGQSMDPVLSQDEVENKEINLKVNYDKKNVTSTKTNEEMTLYKQNLEYDDKGIYVEGYLSQTRNL